MSRSTLDGLNPAVEVTRQEVVAVRDALEALSHDHPEVAAVVLARYIAGLSEDETAAQLHRSVHEVRKEWRFGRIWLARALADLSSTARDATAVAGAPSHRDASAEAMQAGR